MTRLASPPLDVSVVVPVYGPGLALPELQRRLDAAMAEHGLRHELILVDDRGSPQAWQVIRDLAERCPEVVGLRLSRNFGQHAATLCGIAQATGRWVVTMDDDLEHPPESVPALLAAGDDEHPLVYGTFESRTHAAHRNLSSELMRRLLKRAFPELNEDYTSFRAIHTTLARELATFKLNQPYIDGMLSWMTSSVRTVPVAHGQRRHGDSSYTMRKLIAHALNIFVTFSHLPLRLATIGGAALAIASFGYILVVVGLYVSGHLSGSPGYASLMSVVLFACGIQLIILGVIGEYIGRLMGAIYRRPMFVIEKVTAAADAAPGISAAPTAARG